ncbi:MAG: tetratricopeptide repeat protein [Bradymonadia bacterium]|jgi:tetratricopeptide (TPR) repeat protein
MAFWILLLSGVLLVLSAGVMGMRRARRGVGNTRARGGRRALSVAAPVVDEIDEYWGTAQASPILTDGEVGGVSAVQREALRCTASEDVNSPRVLGDDARRLGIAYFQHLLDKKVLPRGSVSLTNESNIIIAQNALRNKQQSATLSHSAVAQRIGQQALCIFEPLSLAVENVERAIECLAPLVEGNATFFVLESTEFAPDEFLSHIPRICEHFKIPQTHVFIRQCDGSFINYIEDIHNFTPSRIDPWQMSPAFFADLLDYAQTAFDEGDSETVMRALAPLMGPLYQRVSSRQDFPKVLLAQALNLTGMTNRALDHEQEAVACFDASYKILREIEDYEAIKAVEANLGITLALMRPANEKNLDRAVHHLKDVTELNPSDDEAWMYLGQAYLQLYQLNKVSANVMRAKRAFNQAYKLKPSAALEQCLRDLGVQPVQTKMSSNVQAEATGYVKSLELQH